MRSAMKRLRHAGMIEGFAAKGLRPRVCDEGFVTKGL
jgi:hypothetical protein